MSSNPEFEVTWHQARELAHQAANLSSTISLPIGQAADFVVAVDVVAIGDMPPFAASRIDGWAVGIVANQRMVSKTKKRIYFQKLIQNYPDNRLLSNLGLNLNNLELN